MVQSIPSIGIPEVLRIAWAFRFGLEQGRLIETSKQNQAVQPLDPGVSAEPCGERPKFDFVSESASTTLGAERTSTSARQSKAFYTHRASQKLILRTGHRF